MNLLIADDEPMIRMGLCSLDWKSVGIEKVFCAANGVEALQYLVEDNIDIMVTDIRMPGLTGLDLAAYLHQHAKDTAVILLTGFGEFQYAQEALRSEVVEYLLKPIKPQELLSVVRKVMITMEQKRYQRLMIREFEDRRGSFQTKEQILRSFKQVNPQVFLILQAMAEEYSNDISLQELACRYHFTAIYLSRMIKKETGFGFSEILTSIRLMNAVECLRGEKEKIGMVCEQTGFKDQRYFSQVFKHVFGCTPGEYKKRTDSKKYSIKEILKIIHDKKQGRDAVNEN